MNKALSMEDDRLDRAAAEVEDEYQVKTKEKEAKKKAAIESIAEYRVTDVRKPNLFLSLFLVCTENIETCFLMCC